MEMRSMVASGIFESLRIYHSLTSIMMVSQVSLPQNTSICLPGREIFYEIWMQMLIAIPKTRCDTRICELMHIIIAKKGGHWTQTPLMAFLHPETFDDGVQHGTKIGDLENQDEADQQGIDTQGLDEGQTDDHRGHDLPTRFWVPGGPLQCTVDGMSHS